VHGLPQVVAEDRVCLGDPGQGPADGLADGDASALVLIGERTDTAPEPCRASQLSDQPVSLGASFGVPGRDASPEVKVVYVDHDPVVLAHARSMLHNVPNTAIIEQDLLEPDEILGDPVLRSVIDFRQPTAFLFLSILHFVSDESDPAGLIAALLDPFPGGSHVAISHATPDTVPEVNDVERVFDEATEQAHVRSRSAVMKLVSGLELIEPGLAWPPEWRPDPGDVVPPNATESYYCVVVARKPELPGADGR
jgi:S-adenosyl methyltransferase